MGRSWPPYGEGLDADEYEVQPVCIHCAMVLEEPKLPVPSISEKEIGWGGRIRTFTVLINSEVSYRLDHAPAVAPNFAASSEKKFTLTARSG